MLCLLLICESDQSQTNLWSHIDKVLIDLQQVIKGQVHPNMIFQFFVSFWRGRPPVSLIYFWGLYWRDENLLFSMFIFYYGE